MKSITLSTMFLLSLISFAQEDIRNKVEESLNTQFMESIKFVNRGNFSL